FWCVGNPLGDPFGGAVLPKIDSLDVAKLLAAAAGEGLIEATSFHDDDLVPWDPAKPEDDLDPKSETYAKLRAIKQVLDKAGLTVNIATCGLHGDKLFRKGGLTNPDPKLRALAKKKVQRTLRIGALFGVKYFTYWVARDGFEVPVNVDWKNVYKWLADGLNGVYDYIQKMKFTNYIGATIEPKPNEPRGHMFLPTAGHAVGFIYGHLKHPEFYGVNPELLQHESMALLNAVHTVGYLTSMKKLFFLHFGSQIKAQFDNDFPPLIGPEGLKETVQMFWALRKVGWKGVVEYDCHMLRADGDPDDPIGCRMAFIRDCTQALATSLLLADRLMELAPAGLSDAQADLSATALMCKLDAKSVQGWMTTK
ncbi:MAG: TIM barrel protein, partial [Kiritimatiellia bacterium]|nr:TIM barrel protein [Kiritimatiellia bacterium]